MSRVIGGRTLYGSLISDVCEKYGWTFDYVMWGISYINISMMMADSKYVCLEHDSKVKNCNEIKVNGLQNFISQMKQINTNGKS